MNQPEPAREPAAQNYALLTIARDEAANLPAVLEAVEAQTVPPLLWVIVENDSTDDSWAIIDGHRRRTAIPHFVPIQASFAGDYQVGSKYARVMAYALQRARASAAYSRCDYVGILDADCIPERAYYARLLNELQARPDLGIISGVQRERASGDRAGYGADDWPRGNCRLWRQECLEETGYPTGISADAQSVAKAEMRGWGIATVSGAIVYCRPTGEGKTPRYYGEAAYALGVPPGWALLKALAYTLRRPRWAYWYASGYARALVGGRERVADPEVRAYFRAYGRRTLGRKIDHLRRRGPQSRH